MFEGALQPLHLLVILVIAVLYSVPRSCLNWAKASEKEFVDSRNPWPKSTHLNPTRRSPQA